MIAVIPASVLSGTCLIRGQLCEFEIQYRRNSEDETFSFRPALNGGRARDTRPFDKRRILDAAPDGEGFFRLTCSDADQVHQIKRTVGTADGARPAEPPGVSPGGADPGAWPMTRQTDVVYRTPDRPRVANKATTLLHGDSREELRKLPATSIDAVITDPIYPEVDREYGRISEEEWHDLMRSVLAEVRRVLKPHRSAVFIIRPNFAKFGRMRLWPWEFVSWAAREWNLVQDDYAWVVNTLPGAGTSREDGLMRGSVKWAVWLGPADCYRSQDKVLCTPSEALSATRRCDRARRVTGPAGRFVRDDTLARAAEERGGTTPFNLLPISVGGYNGETGGHPATTPYELADWWCRYILPEGGLLLDPFCGSGTILEAGLKNGASRVIGIDKEEKYLETARRRLSGG